MKKKILVNLVLLPIPVNKFKTRTKKPKPPKTGAPFLSEVDGLREPFHYG